MKHIRITHPLDWGGHYQIAMDYNPEGAVLSGYILGPLDTTGIVERHLAKVVSVTAAGQPCPLMKQGNAKSPSFSVQIPQANREGFDISIRLGGSEDREGELYGQYTVGEGSVASLGAIHRLTVFETRMLGNEKLYRWLPYKRGTLKPPSQTTDLHTHSSGQISAQGLIDIAQAHHIAYPTRLLDLLHISYPKDAITLTPRFFFPPTDGGNPNDIPKMEDAVPMTRLDAGERDKLKAALAIPADRQMTFGDLEQTIYRYRYPITKHPDAAYDMWHTVAEEYKKQGVSYAEITAVSTSFLTPQNIAFLHEALPKIERETGVKLRFLAGIPRNLSPEILHREIDKLKIMGASPYIVGVDFMGFEDNKTNDLEPYIRTVAAWAHEHDPEFTLRIHAGENRKNMNNVQESLRIAQKHHMRVRIGHAAHGLDDGAMHIAKELARDKLVMIEFNPDSNLALNNIDTAEELDLPKCINHGIPFVVCSDGGGLFQTDARQLAITASFAGVEAHQFSHITRSEQDHRQLEDARFARKFAHLPVDFLEQVKRKCNALSPIMAQHAANPQASNEEFERHLQQLGIEFRPEHIAAATAGKMPLMILGATGERYWNLISTQQRQQIQAGIEKLVEILDPHNVYFLIGRPKDAGITSILSRAVRKFNAGRDTQDQFTLMSATVQADQTTHSFTPGLTHVLPLKGSLFSVPDQLVNYVADNSGHILFMGGGTFVRDAILVARNRKVTFGLMNGPAGASTDKAIMMHPDHQFTNATGMVAHLRDVHPDWFKTIEALEAH